MKDRTLIQAGAISTVVAAICCATPILAISFGLVGLSAWAAKADYALVPILIASIGLVGVGLYRRKVSASAAVDCCQTDRNTRKLTS
ncbi:mercury resistance system transport protein MerF [Bosea vaviloviae]|uniref:Mercury transport protein n=1 Tax=Bosea vaviloviae TaxID=1526658 RepID=A0A0N0M9V6_9HYPH|nr:mercury resistance system transport protein MerF [Bosea vaviloviae]KPH77372.1 hypothetical protein AE618_22760 [Bosea vaviloviae]